jgi:hypothetical protein
MVQASIFPIEFGTPFMRINAGRRRSGQPPAAIGAAPSSACFGTAMRASLKLDA